MRDKCVFAATGGDMNLRYQFAVEEGGRRVLSNECLFLGAPPKVNLAHVDCHDCHDFWYGWGCGRLPSCPNREMCGLKRNQGKLKNQKIDSPWTSELRTPSERYGRHFARTTKSGHCRSSV